MRRRPLCGVGAAGQGSASAIAGCARRRPARPSLRFADIEHADFAWTRGKPAAFQSSSIAERDFCAACGTPLSFRRIDGPRIEIMTGTFDRPDRVVPTRQYGTESRLGWVVGIANLPSQTTLQNYGPEKMSDHRQPPASGP